MGAQNDWVEWHGKSSRPPHKGLVFLRFRDGTETDRPELARRMNWWHINGSPSDIVAFRVVRLEGSAHD